MQTLVDAFGDAVLTTKNDAIVTWNRAAAEVFGYRLSDVFGKAITDILPGMPSQLLDKDTFLASRHMSKSCVEWKMPTTSE